MTAEKTDTELVDAILADNREIGRLQRERSTMTGIRPNVARTRRKLSAEMDQKRKAITGKQAVLKTRGYTFKPGYLVPEGWESK